MFPSDPFFSSYQETEREWPLPIWTSVPSADIFPAFPSHHLSLSHNVLQLSFPDTSLVPRGVNWRDVMYCYNRGSLWDSNHTVTQGQVGSGWAQLASPILAGRNIRAWRSPSLIALFLSRSEGRPFDESLFERKGRVSLNCNILDSPNRHSAAEVSRLGIW